MEANWLRNCPNPCIYPDNHFGLFLHFMTTIQTIRTLPDNRSITGSFRAVVQKVVEVCQAYKSAALKPGRLPVFTGFLYWSYTCDQDL